MKTLPIVKTDRPLALLRDGSGPVWPVRTAHQATVLERLATVFESSLVERPEAESVETPKARRDAVVAALGAEVTDHARLYAHLTGRRCVTVEDRDALLKLDDLEVIVCLEHEVDLDLLPRLYDEPRGDRMPGLVFGATLEALEEQVLLRSAAPVLDAPATVPRADHFASIDLSPIAEARAMRGQRVTGPSSTAEQIKQNFGAGSGVLTIQTHSDGLDAFLRPALGLCSIAGDISDGDMEFPPPCVTGGYCRHYRDRVEVANSMGSLVPPQVIAARILIMDVCWGLLPSPALMDRSWSFTRQILAGGRVGALLTTWDIVISKPQMAVRASDLAVGGASAGATAAAHAADAGQEGSHWCLLGDPDVAVPAPSMDLNPLADILDAYEGAYDERPPEPAAEHPELEFLRALIRASARGDDSAHVSDAAMTAIDVYEHARVENAELEASPDAPGPAARRAILEWLTTRDDLLLATWNAWIEGIEAPTSRFPCWGCGAPAREFVVTLSAGGVRRYGEVCPTCGNAQDAPGDGRRVWYSIEPGGVVRLHGSVQQPGTTAMAVIARNVGDEANRAVPWPVDEDGRLAPTARVEGPWPEDRMRLVVFVMWPDMALGRASRIGRHRTLWVD